jgi:uncharacterized membrane protein
MLRSLLIGALAGSRSLTPLAMVSDAARRDRLPAGHGAPALLADPRVTAGIGALAAAELAGDKWKHAPDRIVLPGMAARVVTSALAAMALAPSERRATAAALGVGAAIASAYLTFAARMRAMRRWGQTSTGLVEDALVVGGAWAAIHAGRGTSPDTQSGATALR